MTETTALLAELDARRQIHDVLQQLARGIDRNDRETTLSCYHPDASRDRWPKASNAAPHRAVTFPTSCGRKAAAFSAACSIKPH